MVIAITGVVVVAVGLAVTVTTGAGESGTHANPGIAGVAHAGTGAATFAPFVLPGGMVSPGVGAGTVGSGSVLTNTVEGDGVSVETDGAGVTVLTDTEGSGVTVLTDTEGSGVTVRTDTDGAGVGGVMVTVGGVTVTVDVTVAVTVTGGSGVTVGSGARADAYASAGRVAHERQSATAPTALPSALVNFMGQVYRSFCFRDNHLPVSNARSFSERPTLWPGQTPSFAMPSCCPCDPFPLVGRYVARRASLIMLRVSLDPTGHASALACV